MSAIFKTAVYPGSLNVSAVKYEVQKCIDETAEANGNDCYSGDWNTFSGVRYEGKIYKTLEGAEFYLQRIAEKWSDAIVCGVETKLGTKFWLAGGWASE